MSGGTDGLVKSLKKFADVQYKLFSLRYGRQVIGILEFPFKVVLSPFTLAFDIAGSAQRGFGVPELISKLSYASIFLGKKVICQRKCRACGQLCNIQCVEDREE